MRILTKWVLAVLLTGKLLAAHPLDEKMRDFIEAKEIAGAVTLVAGPDKVIHQSAVGFADIVSGKPMASDSIFWIASMTKPITATVVMMLQEEGRLSIGDPVSKYLPEFKNLKDAAGNQAEVTIEQCLNHTSGLEEVSPAESENVTTLKELIPLVVAKPLKFTPGSQWTYCQSSINTAARVAEVVSGKEFPELLDDRLFKPLGMKDSTFYLTNAQHARLATSYTRTPAGDLEPVPVKLLNGKSPTSRNRFPMANAGLFSTATDYARFGMMILNDGELDGKRYLKAESVKEMTSLSTGDLTTGFTPGNGWAIGWCLIRQPQGVTGTLSPGTFGHGGLFGTQAWIDPVKKRLHLLLVQRANFSNGDATDVRRGFHEAASLVP